MPSGASFALLPVFEALLHLRRYFAFSECPNFFFQHFLSLSKFTDIVITHDKLYEEIELTTSFFVTFSVEKSGSPFISILFVSVGFNLLRLCFPGHTGDAFGMN
jgi:hypothetical protein